MKRRAKPRGFALGSVSGISGMPVEEEKRTVMGVEGELKCGAVVMDAAVGVGVKVPLRRWPRAWAKKKNQYQYDSASQDHDHGRM